MSGDEVEQGTTPSHDRRRVVSCDLVFAVAEAGEVALQVVAADSAGQVVTERFDVTTDGAPPASLEELRNPQHERIHVVHSAAGRVNVSYRAEIEARPLRAAIGTDAGARAGAPRQASNGSCTCVRAGTARATTSSDSRWPNSGWTPT